MRRQGSCGGRLRAMVGLTLLAGTLGAASLSWGCPFCTVTTTLTERIEQSEACFVVEWMSGRAGDPDRVDPGVTQVRIVHLFQDKAGTRTRGEILHLPSFSPARPGDQFLLFGVPAEGGALQWEGLLECPPELLAYLRERPPDDRPNVERLGYFLDFLEHPLETIAVDAYAEFARCPYADVAALAARLPRAALSRWVSEPAPETGRIARTAFYGMLLGLCGTDEDAQMLERIILTPSDDLRVEIGGLMAGYLHLRGEAGLERLIQHVYAPETPSSDAFAFLQAVRFQWDFGEGRIPRERLRAALHPLVQNPQLTELALADLTRWEDLALVDRLIALLDRPEFERYDVQRAIVGYYLTVSRLDPAGRAPEEQTAIAAAARHLAALRARDPELVELTERRLAMPEPPARRTQTPSETAAKSTVAEAAAPRPPRDEEAAAPLAGNVRWWLYPPLAAVLLLIWWRTSGERGVPATDAPHR